MGLLSRKQPGPPGARAATLLVSSHAWLNTPPSWRALPVLPCGLPWRGHTVGLMFALSRNKFVGS